MGTDADCCVTGLEHLMMDANCRANGQDLMMDAKIMGKNTLWSGWQGV